MHIIPVWYNFGTEHWAFLVYSLWEKKASWVSVRNLLITAYMRWLNVSNFVHTPHWFCVKYLVYYDLEFYLWPLLQSCVDFSIRSMKNRNASQKMFLLFGCNLEVVLPTQFVAIYFFLCQVCEPEIVDEQNRLQNLN